MSKSKLMNNEAGSRFELLIDGRVATYIDYVDHGYALELTHTVTEPDFGALFYGNNNIDLDQKKSEIGRAHV